MRLVQSTKQTHRILPCGFRLLFVFCLQNIRWLLMICLDVFPDIWPDLACICSSFRGVPAGLDIMHKLYGVLRSSDFVLLGANTKMGVWGETFISRWESDRKSKVTRCTREAWRRSHAEQCVNFQLISRSLPFSPFSLLWTFRERFHHFRDVSWCLCELAIVPLIPIVP